jgi:hypothetical protein
MQGAVYRDTGPSTTLYLPIHLYQCIDLSIRLSVYLSIYLSIYPSNCRYIQVPSAWQKRVSVDQEGDAPQFDFDLAIVGGGVGGARTSSLGCTKSL